MADEEHVKRLKEGAEAWNAWRKGNPKVKPELCGAYSRGAYLRGAYFRGADLSEADFQGADLRGADLSGANLSGANLSEADLSEANFRYSYLSNADFHGADFSEADLRGATLYDASFSAASLSSANLSGADLNGADLNGANLSSADLSGANLNFSTISNADLHGATVGYFLHYRRPLVPGSEHLTSFGNIDLSQTAGLQTLSHSGPSIVGTSMLERSQGKIPGVFLKGCGLSDWEIAAAKLHDPDLNSEQITDLAYEIVRIKSDSPIQVNPIFLSYSRKDSKFVDTIEKRFDKKRIRYWRDTRHATSGPLEGIVDRAMKHGRIVLLILSKDSVNSDWVEWEVKKARELSKESGDHVLCPIAVDMAWETCKWPGRLRDQVEKYNILDFSDWKDKDALAGAFQKLIDGLGIYYPKDVATG